MTASTAPQASPAQPPGPRQLPHERSPRIPAAAVGWALLGLASSVLLTLTGSRVAETAVPWWFRLTIGSAGTQRVLFYAGMVGLVIAWLGLGRFARVERCRPSWMAAIAFLWCIPLLAGAPLFSHDIYSYLAQGTIAHSGLSPYRYAPTVLARLGHHHVLQGVDPFWRHDTAPYGPLFIGVISLIVGLTGAHVVAGVVAVRLFVVVGLVLLAVFVPRLARRVGGDPVRATWLAVASPLILLQLVAPGHNDLLMAGVMVAGVALAMERRPLLGIAVCVLAATIKLPAAAAAVFIAVAWIRTAPSWSARAAIAARAVVVAVGTAAVITLITGFGVGWISTSLFSTPGRVRLAITPATDLSFTIAKLLSGVGFSDVEPVLRALMVAATVIAGLILLARTRWRTLIPCLGFALLAAAIGGPALWPWYLAWGLALLAAGRPTQRSWVMVVALVVASSLVKPGGILLLSRGSSPVIVVIWLLLVALACLAWRRRLRVIPPGFDARPAATP